MAIIRDTIKEFGKEKLRDVTSGFLTGALGGTVGGAIARGVAGTGSGAKPSGNITASTGDVGKDTVNAIRDLQSDFNGQSGIQKEIVGVLQSQSALLGDISKTLMQTNTLLRDIYQKINSRSSFGFDIPGPGGGTGSGRGSRIPGGGAGTLGRIAGPAAAVAGGAIEGYNEYQDTGSLGRAAAVGTGTAAGGYAGGLAGMKVGAALGSFGGPIGMGIGGIVGGIAGGIGGAYLGSTATRAMMGPADKSAAMAELAQKEELQKQKAAQEIQKQSIVYNSQEIVFKADSIKFEVSGKTMEGAAAGNLGGFTGGGGGSGSVGGGAGYVGGGAGPAPSGGGGGGGMGRGGGGAFAAKDLPPEAQGLLSAISAGESGGRYDIINYVGARGRSKYFEGTRHPFEGQRGYTASGRYQFLWTTWEKEARALGVDPREFTPENQDRAAWSHAQRVYAAKTRRNLAEDLKNPQMAGYISQVLRPTWHGIKGGDFLSREVAKASGAGGAGAGGSIMASSAVPGGAAVPGSGSADMPAAGAMAMEGKGFSPEVKAAAAQASIATRGRFLNEGQFGPFLPGSSTPSPVTAAAGSTMEGFMPPTAPEAAAATEPFKPSKEYAEQKLGPQGGTAVRKPRAAATAPGVRSGPSQDEVTKLWERYNETQHPADFVRADNAMKAMQAAQAAAPAPAGRVVAKGGKKAGKGADLGPASMYGESDAEYRARIAAQEAAVKEGAPGYEGVPGKILTHAQQREKDLEAERIRRAAEEESRDDAERISAAGERAKLVQDAELEKGAAQGKSLAQMRQEGSGAAMTIRNALRGRDLTALSERRADAAEGDKASPGAEMTGETVGGVAGFDASAWSKAYQLQRAPDTASGAGMGFGAGGADLNRITDGQAAMRMSADLDAYKMQQFDKTINPAAQFGFEDKAPAGGAEEFKHSQTDGAVPSSEMLRSMFGELPNLGYAM